MTIQSPHGKGVRRGTEYPRAYSMDLPGKKVSFPGSLLLALLWSFQALREDSNIGRGCPESTGLWVSQPHMPRVTCFHDQDSGRGDTCLSLHNNPLTLPS